MDKAKKIGNELQNNTNILLPEQSTALTQTGDKNVQVVHADNVNIVVTGISQPSNLVPNVPPVMSNDYYNLFVVADDIIPVGNFILQKDRALTESMLPETKARFSNLSNEAITFIKTLPSLFVNENHSFGHTDEEQMAYYGFVTNVRVQDNGIKVYYNVKCAFPQQRLNEIQDKLSLGYATSFNELNRMHWSIKRINLIEELKDAGIDVLVSS